MQGHTSEFFSKIARETGVNFLYKYAVSWNNIDTVRRGARAVEWDGLENR